MKSSDTVQPYHASVICLSNAKIPNFRWLTNKAYIGKIFEGQLLAVDNFVIRGT